MAPFKMMDFMLCELYLRKLIKSVFHNRGETHDVLQGEDRLHNLAMISTRVNICHNF